MSNEIKVNWDLAPPDAIGMAQRGVDLAFVDNKGNVYLDNHWGISMGWRLVVTRPQLPQPKKTVEDVVKAYPQWPYSECGACTFFIPSSSFVFVDNMRFDKKYAYLVCTREQYEAYTGAIKIGKILDSRDKQEHKVAKEAEKWTHTHGGGLKCRVVAVDGEYSWVADEYGRRVTEYNSSLKPIKPTITESDLWRMANMPAFKEWKVVDFIAHVHEEFEVAGNE